MEVNLINPEEAWKVQLTISSFMTDLCTRSSQSLQKLPVVSVAVPADVSDNIGHPGDACTKATKLPSGYDSLADLLFKFHQLH